MLSGFRAFRALAFVCLALLSVVTMGGCSGDDGTPEPEAVVTPTTPAAEEYRLQVKAQIAPMSAESRQIVTRALSDGTDALTKTWGSGDKVRVYDKHWNTVDDKNILTPQTYGNASATLTGTIGLSSLDLATGQDLHFVFPGGRTEWTYMGQTGTLDGLAANYDYAIGTSKILSKDSTKKELTAKDFTLSNEQAIVKFVLKNSNGSSDLKVKSLTISTANNKLVQTKDMFARKKDGNNQTIEKVTTYGPITVAPSSATNTLWVALRNEKDGSDKYVLTATDDSDNDYRFSKSDIPFTNGNAYEVQVNMGLVYKGDLEEPLTLEAVESGTVTVNGLLDYPKTKLWYSFDKVSWTQIDGGLNLNVDKGMKVYLRGDNTTFASGTEEDDNFVHIGCTDDCYIYGNIMSLAYPTGFSSSDTYNNFTGTFYRMFSDNDKLDNHSSRKLILPLPDGKSINDCYTSTFAECNLTYTTIP